MRAKQVSRLRVRFLSFESGFNRGVEVRCSRLKSLLPVGYHLWRHHRNARETSFTPTGCIFCILSWGLN